MLDMSGFCLKNLNSMVGSARKLTCHGYDPPSHTWPFTAVTCWSHNLRLNPELRSPIKAGVY